MARTQTQLVVLVVVVVVLLLVLVLLEQQIRAMRVAMVLSPVALLVVVAAVVQVQWATMGV